MVDFDTNGLEFSLTVLFVVLAIEQYKSHKRYLPFIIGAVASLLAIILVPVNNMLLVSIAFALFGMSILKKRFEDDIK